MNLQNINSNKEFLKAVINGQEPETTIFYHEYDMLVWDIARKWSPAIKALSKNQYEIEDMHNEVWAHIFKNIHKCDLDRSGISNWIYLVSESKLGMIKRSLETQKNSFLRNEMSYSLNAVIQNSFDDIKNLEISNLVKDVCEVDDIVTFQEFLLDFIYLLLELIDACTDKERKVYLLKIKGKSQNEIAQEAKVSKSYIPKVFKRLSSKFKFLYDSLEEQCYIDKEERDSLAKDLLNKKKSSYICKKYGLEQDTVNICKEILEIIGL